MWRIKTQGGTLFTHINIAPFLSPLFCIKVDIKSQGSFFLCAIFLFLFAYCYHVSASPPQNKHMSIKPIAELLTGGIPVQPFDTCLRKDRCICRASVLPFFPWPPRLSEMSIINPLTASVAGLRFRKW